MQKKLQFDYLFERMKRNFNILKFPKKKTATKFIPSRFSILLFRFSLILIEKEIVFQQKRERKKNSVNSKLLCFCVNCHSQKHCGSTFVWYLYIRIYVCLRTASREAVAAATVTLDLSQRKYITLFTEPQKRCKERIKCKKRIQRNKKKRKKLSI